MEGSAIDERLTEPERGRQLAIRWSVSAFAALLVGAALPGSSAANPVSPLVVDEATSISDPRPWVSPTGEQVVTYLRQGGEPLPTAGLVARKGGGPFTAFEALSARPAVSTPLLGFGPDGTALITWSTIESGLVQEQTIRPPGGPFEPAGPTGACDGPVAFSVSGSGEVISGCPSNSGLLPPWTGLAGLSLLPSRIAPDLAVTPAGDDPAIRAFTAWGPEGTGVVVFGYGDGESPAKTAIEARVSGPGSSWAETSTVAEADESGTIEPTGAAVLPNGTVAITADTGEGAALFTRPPGPASAFTRTEVDQGTASMPAADDWGRLHFLTSDVGDDGETSWWVRIRNLDGTLSVPIPIPTVGREATPVANGFQVFPNGAEAIVTRSASGFFIAFRRPGAGAFSVPRRLAGSAGADLGSAGRTPQGDVLLVWRRDATPTTAQLLLGGWDSGSRPRITSLSVPKRVRRGVRARFSVKASDPMGISRIVWRFPRNRRASGATVGVRLTRPGANRVQVIVFDRAEGRSVRYRQVEVVEPRKGRAQGRPGTSGSPRP